MPSRTSLELSLPDTGQTHMPIAVPATMPVQANARSRDLAKVEENTQLHITAIAAHERKAEQFVEVNVSIANKSTDAFMDYARASQGRVEEAQGMLFERDIHLVEHHFRQSLFDSLSANARETARQTGLLASMSVLPAREEPVQKGFLARLFGV